MKLVFEERLPPTLVVAIPRHFLVAKSRESIYAVDELRENLLEFFRQSSIEVLNPQTRTTTTHRLSAAFRLEVPRGS